MRSALVTLFAAMLATGDVGAQSPEETYAKRCAQPQKADHETCLALGQVLMERRDKSTPTAGGSKATPSASDLDPTWGLLALLVSKAWAVEMPGMNIVDRFAWIEDRAAIRYTSEMRAGMNTEIVFRPGPERGTLSAQIDWAGFRSEALFRFEEDRLVSDWYLLKIGKDQDAHRREITLTDDGQYGARMAVGHGGKDRPEFPIWGQQYQSYSEEGIAQVSAEGKGKNAMIDRMVKAKDAADAQAAKEEKAQRSAERAAMFNSLLQGVSQGLAEADTGGYAESQANLNATVADIQYAAAVERQQQTQAQQQAQARAAEEKRQQLAANARWVAEKEQAATEYRSGQVDASAAREAQPVAQQQAEQQQRASAERSRQAKLDSGSSNPARSNSNPDAQPQPISTGATQQESKCSEAPGFRKIFGYAEKTRELAMRSMTETPHLEPLQDVSCTQPPNLGYTLEGWWKCTAMAPTGLMVKHCPQSNSGVSSQ